MTLGSRVKVRQDKTTQDRTSVRVCVSVRVRVRVWVRVTQDKTQDKTRPHKTRQARQDNVTQDRTRPDKTRQSNTRQDPTTQEKTRPHKTRRDKQDKTAQHKAKQGLTYLAKKWRGLRTFFYPGVVGEEGGGRHRQRQIRQKKRNERKGDKG